MGVPQVNVYNDSIKSRARHERFRGIGNPFNFLDSIGIVPIKEFIYHGATLIDLAEELNLPITILRKWIDENGYQSDLEEAAVVSAEGYISKGEKLLNQARNAFELKKAKVLIEHGRFMASKKDKKTYGTAVNLDGGPAAVMYQFNIQQPTEQTPKNNDPKIIEGEAKQVNLDEGKTVEATVESLPEISFRSQDADSLGDIPEHLKNTSGLDIKPTGDEDA